MNFRDLRGRIEHLHRGNPSKQVLLDASLRQIEECLGFLSREGHHFHLAEGHERHQEFPRTVYHFRLGTKLVKSRWELEDLGEGWFDSGRDAELHEGLDIQFAGRGGVRRHSLPALTNGESHDLMPSDWKEKAKEDFLRQRERGEKNGT